MRTAPVPTPDQALVVRAFKDAWSAHDIEALVDLLDPRATAVADGGGHVSAQTAPVTGAREIARTLVEIAAAAPGVRLVERTVNGLPGLVGVEDGTTTTVIAFDVEDDVVRSLWVVRNPEKLTHWQS